MIEDFGKFSPSFLVTTMILYGFEVELLLMNADFYGNSYIYN